MTGLEIGAEVEAVKMKGLEEGKELAQQLRRGYWVVVLLEGPGLEVEIEIAEEVLESNSTSQFEAVKQLEEPVSKQKSSSKKQKAEQEQADFEPAQPAAGPIQNSHLKH